MWPEKNIQVFRYVLAEENEDARPMGTIAQGYLEHGKPLRLTATERESALWKKILAHLDERVYTHRVKNDNRTLTDIETAGLRGKIAECKYWQGLNKPEDHPRQ